MSEQDYTVDPLTTASDKELLDELIRRGRSSTAHGFVAVVGRPKEGSLTESEGRIAIAALDGPTLQFLVGLLVSQFRLHGNADGTVTVPPMSISNDQLSFGDVRPKSESTTVDSIRRWLLGIQGITEVWDGDRYVLYSLVRREALQKLLRQQGFQDVAGTGNLWINSTGSVKVTLYDILGDQGPFRISIEPF